MRPRSEGTGSRSRDRCALAPAATTVTAIENGHLQNDALSLKGKRPGIVGTYTNDLVYERLAPGILEELEARNPKDDKGHRKGKHHQLLTEDVGHPALAQHLSQRQVTPGERS